MKFKEHKLGRQHFPLSEHIHFIKSTVFAEIFDTFYCCLDCGGRRGGRERERQISTPIYSIPVIVKGISINKWSKIKPKDYKICFPF